MTRALPEWIAEHPDQKVPPRVIVRVFEKAGKRCENCTRALRHRKDWELDHIKALKNGGQHREGNLQALCVGCHSEKSREDVAEKSKVYEAKKKHLGIRNPSSFKSKGFTPAPKQNRATGEIDKWYGWK
jgi:5-methylcytosine-specific restriction endonuclease McrA